MEGEAKWTKEEMEGKIQKAIQARMVDFKSQADSLTLEDVRRAIEKDLGINKFSLDTHKKFIKLCVDKCFKEEESETNVEASEETKSKTKKTKKDKKEEIQISSEPKKEDAISIDEISIDKPDKVEKTEKSEINEDIIKEAMKKRASFLKENLETISLQKVRRLLEEDLKLEKKTLDSYKDFISSQIDEVLKSPEKKKTKPQNGIKKDSQKDSEKAKKTEKASKRSLEVSDESDNDHSDNSEEVKPKRTKTAVSKRARPGPKTTVPEKDEKKTSSGMKVKKIANKKTGVFEEEKGKSGDSENNDSGSNSSSNEEDSKKKHDEGSKKKHDEGSKKKQEKLSPQVYGKKVEKLKSIIKSCGLIITPTVYKKAKQAPENKREAVLIKELEDILKKEGLSTNPSEKEIKEVKKRKEKAKELEGIDTSNIITSSRRRSSSFWVPPPKPPVLDSDSESESESDDDQNDDDDDDDVVMEDVENDADANGDADEDANDDEDDADNSDDDDGDEKKESAKEEDKESD